MWRIFGLVFFNDKDRFVDVEHKVFRKKDIVEFLETKGVGLYDTACAVRRTKNTASDKDLEVVENTDLEALLRLVPHCSDIVATGQKAADIVAAHFGVQAPRVGFSVRFVFDGRVISLWRMPSSSRAYPMKLERKAEFYAVPLGRLA